MKNKFYHKLQLIIKNQAIIEPVSVTFDSEFKNSQVKGEKHELNFETYDYI